MDPYRSRASQGLGERRPRGAAERVDELEHFVGRLRRLGATDDEIASVRATWHDVGEEWTAERRAEVARWNDDRLRDELLAVRDEWREHTTDEEADATRAELAAHGLAQRQARAIIGRNVAAILGWVGTDPIRAIAVLDLELGPEGAQRKTLVEPLQALVEF